MKQAPRQWNKKLHETLVELNFVQSNNDFGMYIWKLESRIVIIAVYVDDLLISGNDEEKIKIIKLHIHRITKLNILGKSLK